MAWQELKKHLTLRRQTLRNVEQKHESQWRELRDYVNPNRGRFSGDKPDDYSPSYSKILDGTPQTSLRTLSSGMQSGLTSPSRQWFKLTLHDAEAGEIQSVREWCDEVQRRMMTVMAASGFYQALHNLYEEIAQFGTGCLIILPDYDSVISVRSLTAGTYYIGRAATSKVDTLYRDLWMTAGQMVYEFGKDNVTDAVKSAFDNDNSDQLFRVCHAIEPDTGKRSRHEFMSVYWEPSGDKGYLRLSGYDTFPAMCPRWVSSGEDVYGYGPASEALPDIKTLMRIKADFLQGLGKEVNPPVVASRQVLMGGVKTMPGGITYVEGQAGPLVTPLYGVNLNLADVNATLEQYKNDVRRALYVDLFMMLTQQDGSQMTAREVAERHEEKMLALGPVLESLEWELLIPAIERIFDIMQDAGLIPEPPEEIQGQEIKIEFVSVLAQAQKMMGLSSLEQSLAFAVQIAQADPTILDVVDTEKALRRYVDMVGAPADLLHKEEEVQKIRQERQAQQAQAATIEQAQAEAQTGATLAQGAKSLSDIPMSNGMNALEALSSQVMGGTYNGF